MKRILLLLCINILIAVICKDCQLANPNFSGAGDQLVGAYVTTQAIDNFDFKISAFGNVSLEPKQSNKIFGTFHPDTNTLTFPELSGYTLLSITEEENGEKYYSYHSDIAEMSYHLGDTTEMVGTIYYNTALIPLEEEERDGEIEVIDKEIAEGIFATYSVEDETLLYIDANAYPVYLTPSGEYYLKANDARIHLDGNGSIGLSYSVTETYNNKPLAESALSKVTVTFEAIMPSTEFVFSHIDQKGNTTKEEHFTGENIPEQYSFPTDCDYILVTKTNSDGTVTHDIIDKETDYYNFYIKENELFCIKKHMEILP